MTSKAAEAPRADNAPPGMPPALARSGKALVYLAMILAPLLVLRPGVGLYNGLDTPRRLALFLCAGLMAALIVFSWAWRRRIVWRWHPLDMPVGVYFLVSLICSLFGAYPFISLWGPLWSQDGLLLTFTMILLYMGVKTFLCEPGDTERAMTVALVTGGLVAVVGLADYLFIAYVPGYQSLNPNFTPAFDRFRLVATLGNSMFTGTYLAALIPLGAIMTLAAATLKRRVLLLSIISLMLVALLLTQARAAWLAMAITLPILMLMVGKISGKHLAAMRTAWWMLGLGVLLALVVGLGVPSIRARLVSVFNVEDATTLTRKIYMAGAYRVFTVRPAQGWGPGTIRTVFPQFRPQSVAREAGMALDCAYSTAHPHNLFLEIAAEMGLLGLAAMVFLLITVAGVGVKAFRENVATIWPVVGLLGLLFAYLISNMSAFDNAATQSLFWIALGLLAALSARDVVPSPRLGGLAKPLSAASARGLVIAALVIGLGTILHVGMEGMASAFTLRAKNHVERGKNFMNATPATDADRLAFMQASYQEFQAAERDLHASLPFTVVPDWQRGVWVGDVLTYETWCEACALQLKLFRQDRWPKVKPDMATMFGGIFGAEHEKFLQYAQTGLRMIDRDGFILRSMEQQQILDARIAFWNMRRLAQQKPKDAAAQWNNYLSILNDATSKAQEYITRLHGYEPYSAELYLMDAEVYGILGETGADPNSAYENFCEAQVRADTATRIDPTDPIAFASLAGYMNHQVEMGSPKTQYLVPNIIQCYARVEELNPRVIESLRAPLNQDDLYAYAKCLFLYGLDPAYQNEQMRDPDAINKAIERGKELAPDYRDMLRERVKKFYGIYKRPAAELAGVLAALNAPAPQPAPAPAPAPLAPAASSFSLNP